MMQETRRATDGQIPNTDSIPLRLNDQYPLFYSLVETVVMPEYLAHGAMIEPPSHYEILRKECGHRLATADPTSAEFAILMDTEKGPVYSIDVSSLDNLSEVDERLTSLLDESLLFEKVFESSDSSPSCYRFKNKTHMIVTPLGIASNANVQQERQLYIDIKRNIRTTGVHCISLRLCVSTDEDGELVQKFSPSRPIATVEITAENSVMGSLKINRYTAIRSTGEEPLVIDKSAIEQLHDRPIELMMTAAVCMLEAVKHEPEILTAHPERTPTAEEKPTATPAIDRKTMKMLRTELRKLEHRKASYLPTTFQDILITHALKGNPIDTHLVSFINICLEAVNTNPGRFWRYMTALGLNRQLSRLSYFSDSLNRTVYDELSRARATDKLTWLSLHHDVDYLNVPDGETIQDELDALNDLKIKEYSGIKRAYHIFGDHGEYETRHSALDTLVRMFNLLPVVGRRVDAINYLDFRETKKTSDKDIIAMLRCINIAHQGMLPERAIFENGHPESIEAPFGAVIVDSDGNILAEMHNQLEEENFYHRLKSPRPGNLHPLQPFIHHAEIIAMHKALQKVIKKGGANLEGCTLYSTVEPCGICGTVLRLLGISRAVWALDSREGAFTSESPVALRPYDPRLEYLGYPPEYTQGVLEHDAGPIVLAGGIKDMIKWKR